MQHHNFIGLDLGQTNDYTAWCVLQLGGDKNFKIRHLDRVRHVPYPEIVQMTMKMMDHPLLRGNSTLVVDATGVGRPVVDMFNLVGLTPISITITGGDQVKHDGNEFKVPKRDLVGMLQRLLQTGELKVSNKLTLARVLVKEMSNFKVKISTKGHDSYGAWREGEHDDLVLAVACASWFGRHFGVPRVGAVSPKHMSKVAGSNSAIYKALYEDDDEEMEFTKEELF